MTEFATAAAGFTGRFTVQAPIEVVFPLFSPLGERDWVPGWNPTLVHPPGVSWDQGQIFQTPGEHGDVTWIITALDRGAHRVEYHRVEAGRHVTRVRVACTGVDDRRTEVVTTYLFVGLSAAGNDEVRAMTAEAYDQKMTRWAEWIAAYVSRRP